MLFVLNSAKGQSADLQRLVSYDYLLVHSGDVDGGPESIHPSVPFRGTQLLVKRDVLRVGLEQMFSRELLDKTFEVSGIVYRSNALTSAFLNLLDTSYSHALRTRSEWIFDRFGSMEDRDLSNFMTRNIGRWGAEFDRITAIKDLEL